MSNSPIRFTCKPYSGLSLDELYELMVLRQRVFVVEQACAYQDADGRDKDAYHLVGQDEDGRLVAYARLLPGGAPHADRCFIGRIVTHPDYRGKGIGAQLLQQSIEHCQRLFGDARSIWLSAQVHLTDWYGRFGFVPSGKAYLEDGIPHIQLKMKNEK